MNQKHYDRFFIRTLLYLSLSLPIFAAAYPSEVNELHMGSCWVQGYGDVWRLASFNDGRAFELDRIQVRMAIKNNLNPHLDSLGLGPAPSRYEVYFYCSGAGHSVFLSFLDEKKPLCIRTDASFQNFDVYVNHDALPERGCQAASPATVILMTAFDEDTQQIEERLTQDPYNQWIQDLEVFRDRVVVHLKPEHIFKEKDFLDLIKYDLVLWTHVRTGLLDELVLINGEQIFLWKDGIH